MYGLSREVSAAAMVVVTTNAEKSAEAEVADCEPVKAKGRMVFNINRRCMFRYELLTRCNGRNVDDATTTEIGTISRQQKSRAMGDGHEGPL